MKKFIKQYYTRAFDYYAVIVRMYTGYRFRNIPLLIGLLCTGFISLFFRESVITSLSDYPLLLTLLFYNCNLYIIFLQFNLGCRLTITFGKGLPQFISKIKEEHNGSLTKYLIGFLVYNLLLTFLSTLVLLRLYSVIREYEPGLYDVIQLYNVLFSYVLYRIYMDLHFADFTIHTVFTLRPVTYSRLQRLLLLGPLTTLILVNILNIFTYFNGGDTPHFSASRRWSINHFFPVFNTVYCEPTGGSNSQANGNVQSGDGVPQNTQGNRNSQGSPTGQSANTQTNHNEQLINTPSPPVGADEENTTTQVFTLTVKDKFQSDSFWSNISFLENIKSLDVLNEEFIQARIDLLVYEAINTSKFNEIIFNNHPNKMFADTLFKDQPYARFFEYPVLFNGTYEVGTYTPSSTNYFEFNTWLRTDSTYSMLELYNYIRGLREFEYQDIILTNIRTMFCNSASRSREITDKFLNEDLWVRMVQKFYKIIYTDSLPDGVYVYHPSGPLKLLFVRGEFQCRGSPFPVQEFMAFDNLNQIMPWLERYRSELNSKWAHYLNLQHNREAIQFEVGFYMEWVHTGTIGLTVGNLDRFTRCNDIDNWTILTKGIVPDPEHFTSKEQYRYFEEDLDIRRRLVVQEEVEQYLRTSKLIRD